MVACDLWRAVTLWSDMGYGTFDLHFVKNKEQQEVDFLISRDRAPFLLIEAKFSDTSPSPALPQKVSENAAGAGRTVDQ